MMNIGIASPVQIGSLSHHFDGLHESDLSLGLGGNAVNILIDGFIQQGHHVTVFTLDPNIEDDRVLIGNGIKVFIGRYRTSPYKKMLDFCGVEYRTIKRFIGNELDNLDVVNAHWSYEYAIGALLACPKMTMVTFRDDAPSILKLVKHPYRFSRLLMDKWVRYKAKYVSYNSTYLKDLINIEGIVIGNPISDRSINFGKRHIEIGTEIRIFFVSNGTDARKNPHRAVDAFKILQKEYSNIEMHFIGKGYEVQGKFASNYRDISGLFFHGFQRQDTLFKMMGDYHIMVHTSLEESFGNNLIEAMAQGIPVVAGERSGAVPWVLNHGKAGILVDVSNAESIVNGLKKLIEDDALYDQLSEAGRKFVFENFGARNVCTKYINEYRKLMR